MSGFAGSSVYPTKFGTYDYGDSCLVDGSTFNFWEQYSGACHCEHANVNSSQFDTTPFDPTVWFSAPLQTQFLGEVKYLQDDMPGTGTQNSAEVFSSLKEQQATTGSFVPLGCGSTAVNDQPSAWGGPFVANCQLFSIWEL